MINPFPEKFTDEQWEQQIEQCKLDSRNRCLPQVDALLQAGWRFELPEIVNNWKMLGEGSEPWQWYWRRPPRKKGGKGMKFHSTNQAYNSLMREQHGNDWRKVAPEKDVYGQHYEENNLLLKRREER